MTKIGIIRCHSHSDACAGFNCFPALRDHSGTFAEYDEPVELIGFDTCGGCSRGKADRIVARASRLKEKGAEVIHLGNCLVGACPSTDLYRESIARETGLRVVDKTH